MRQNTWHRSTGDVTFKKNKSLLLFRLYHQELCGRVGLGRRGSRGPRLHLSLLFLPSAAVGLHKTWVYAVPKKNADSYMHKSRYMPHGAPKDGSFLFLKQF